MPKARTYRAARKRFKISKNKKFIVRHAGQDHFNARDTGKMTVSKRHDRVVAKVSRGAIRRVLPYFKKRT